MLIANCKVSILRGTYKDPLGDTVESDNPTYEGVPASIREVASNETTVSEGMPRQVRFLVGRLPAGTDVQYEDRLRDEDNGRVYQVDGIDETNQSAILETGIRLELRRVS
jgi:hypothetical protein